MSSWFSRNGIRFLQPANDLGRDFCWILQSNKMSNPVPGNTKRFVNHKLIYFYRQQKFNVQPVLFGFDGQESTFIFKHDAHAYRTDIYRPEFLYGLEELFIGLFYEKGFINEMIFMLYLNATVRLVGFLNLRLHFGQI